MGGLGCPGALGPEQKKFNERRREREPWDEERLLQELIRSKP